MWVAGDGGFGSSQPIMISTDNALTWSLIPALSSNYGFINGLYVGPGIIDLFGNLWDDMVQHIGNCFS